MRKSFPARPLELSVPKVRHPTRTFGTESPLGLGGPGPGQGCTVEFPAAGCPKRMVFGPCGGVRDDGRCELAEHRCAFLDRPLVRWPEPPVRHTAPSALLGRAASGPVVIADLSVTP